MPFTALKLYQEYQLIKKYLLQVVRRLMPFTALKPFHGGFLFIVRDRCAPPNAVYGIETIQFMRSGVIGSMNCVVRRLMPFTALKHPVAKNFVELLLCVVRRLMLFTALKLMCSVSIYYPCIKCCASSNAVYGIETASQNLM